ncbi:ABC transporter ATP-binding protein [Sphingomonas nostoxanthinifaciens]|uniref:ABC transporter ATP-binding protein n=1 Tax=Sphingomonas nostoxanthinifaciens TaxID=2872652 RepID=UPI001CC1EB48|nr:ABC transporter ATP-binding protein [Sphingomonas nostoxanthinifaciens]UAK24991.1 ABC transporter ATP-binding protein [Sphingomonas nostoxanthinifaciens]
MIAFHDVSKTYHIRKFEKRVFTNLNFAIHPGESIGICGANGAGKSTLMRLIAGVEQPTSGRITRGLSTSWPIGYANCFQSSLTGADNARFIARIYGEDEEQILDFVQDFAQLGPYLYQPVHTYSAGMNARLAFGISLAISFQCYLVDEVTSAGDERFRVRCEEALLHRRDNATLIMISHDPGTLRQFCRRGAVVYGGNLVFFDTIDEASEVHHRLQMRAA